MLTLLSLLALPALFSLTTCESILTKREKCLVDGFDTPCTTFSSDLIDGIQLDVFQIEGVNSSLPHLGYVTEAAKVVMPTYSSFLKGEPMRVDVHVVNAISLFDAAGFARVPTPGYCVIQVQVQRSQTNPYVLRSENTFKGTIAHELCHCVQFTTQPAFESTRNALKLWWSEGTAEYFGCHYYPPNSSEWRPGCTMEDYNPGLPLYTSSDGGYSAALFYQYLENSGWMSKQIHDWMLNRATVDSVEDLMASMSQDDALVAAFPRFATSFIDEKITFSNGQTVLTTFSVEDREYTFPYVNGSSDELVIRTPRWTIQELFYTTFSKDKRVSFSFVVDEPGDDGTILQFRINGRSEWRTVKSGTMVVVQYPDISGCLDDTTTYDFLVTSTSDPARDVVYQDQLAYSKITFYVSNMSEG